MAVGFRVLVLSLLLPALALAEESSPRTDAPPSGLSGVLIGAVGAALTGGYLAGAFLTKDQPSGVPLAVTGGIVAGGLLGVGIALGVGSKRDDPGSLLRYILVPVLSGLAGAAIGGLAAGLGAATPGTGRTVTHVVVVTFLIGETIALEIFR